MLFAPRPGAELRTQLGEQAGRLRNSAGGAYSTASDKVSQIMDRGREAYDRAKSASGSPGGTGLGNTGMGSTGLGSTGTTGNTGSLSGSPYSTAGSSDRG